MPARRRPMGKNAYDGRGSVGLKIRLSRVCCSALSDACARKATAQSDPNQNRIRTQCIIKIRIIPRIKNRSIIVINTRINI